MRLGVLAYHVKKGSVGRDSYDRLALSSGLNSTSLYSLSSFSSELPPKAGSSIGGFSFLVQLFKHSALAIAMPLRRARSGVICLCVPEKTRSDSADIDGIERTSTAIWYKLGYDRCCAGSLHHCNGEVTSSVSCLMKRSNSDWSDAELRRCARSVDRTSGGRGWSGSTTAILVQPEHPCISQGRSNPLFWPVTFEMCKSAIWM